MMVQEAGKNKNTEKAYTIRRMRPEDAGKVAELEAANFSQPWKEADFQKAAGCQLNLTFRTKPLTAKISYA